MTTNVHFNVSVTSRDLQTSRLGLVSAGEAKRLGLVSVSATDVSCPSLPHQISTAFAPWQRYCTACSSGCQPNFAALNRGRHLRSAGRPSRWALAHISSWRKRWVQKPQILKFCQICVLWWFSPHKMNLILPPRSFPPLLFPSLLSFPVLPSFPFPPHNLKFGICGHPVG